jgi:hypothetical protein
MMDAFYEHDSGTIGFAWLSDRICVLVDARAHKSVYACLGPPSARALREKRNQKHDELRPRLHFKLPLVDQRREETTTGNSSKARLLCTTIANVFYFSLYTRCPWEALHP